jgi:hypothetical protein
MTLPFLYRRLRQVSGLSLSLGTALLVSCASITGGMDQTASPAARHELSETSEALVGASPQAQTAGDRALSPSPSADAQTAEVLSQPQLVKQAHITMVLQDLDAAAEKAQTIIGQTQGDLLGLQDHRSPEGVAHQISLTLRIPHQHLDEVLADIRNLGSVQQQSITVEDVSDQLVDLDARLKNLRQSEAALLEIMDRSGEIADVLEVSRELSNVRESIERMAAQQQNLQRRVAYSYLYLTLKSPTTAVVPLRPAQETLGNTWQAATRSVKAFTLGGLKVSLWLLAYSPYLLLLAILGVGGYRLRTPRPAVTPEGEGEQS